MNKKRLVLGVVVLLIILAAVLAFFFWPRNKGSEEAFTDERYLVQDTGLSLIDQALADKKINFETALIYKVKFLFRDPSLPQEYYTKAMTWEDGGTFAEVWENWDKLSAATKEALAPYFRRPDDPESYLAQALNSEAQSTGFLPFISTAYAYDRPISYKSENALVTADGKVRVWYLEKKETVNGAEKITKIYYDVAQKIVANLNADGAYAQYVGLLGKVPPADGTLGGDDKTDIYIAPGNYSLLANSDGSSSLGVNAPDNGNGRSSFIIIRANLNDKELKTTTVHELFHAFQRAFNCWLIKANWWWIEGTATWSEDFIYPLLNSEQGYVHSFIPKAEQSLNKNGDNFEYGAYVFPFYLSKTYDRSIVTKIFEACQQTNDPLPAAEKIIDGGFKKNWPEFTLWNYNKKPIENYKTADQSKTFPANSSESSSNAEGNFIAGLGEMPYPTKDLASLSSQILSFTIDEDQGKDIRKVTFKNLKNFTGKTDKAAIKAVIYPKNGGAAYSEDWTDRDSRGFCLDKADEDFDKIVLIFSNADTKNKITASEIKTKTADSCFEISQGETMSSKPIFGIEASYRGTVQYQAEGSLVKDSVPADAKYPYLGKWQVKVVYRENWPTQRLYSITNSPMYFAYDHTLEFDLGVESVEKEGAFTATTKEAKFDTPGWVIHNELSGQSTTIPQNNTPWDAPQKGVIYDLTADGAKLKLPDFVLYNSGGYRDLPHPIILEIKQ